MFGEHPILAPMVVAAVLAGVAIAAAAQSNWVAALLAYGDAIGMTAIAAHSRIERKGGL